MDAAFREWVVVFVRDGYVVLYWLDDDDVVLLAIRHGREAGYDENFGALASDEE